MPVYVMQHTLWEVADVIEQIYTIAFTQNLYPSSEDRQAAMADYQAEHEFSTHRLCELLRYNYLTMREIEQRAIRVKLMRLYARRWRPWDSEDRLSMRRARQARRPRPPRKPAPPRTGSCPTVAPESGFLDEVTAQSST